MRSNKTKIIQHTDNKIDISSLFCRGRESHIGIDFNDTLQILKDADSIHMFCGSNSLFDRVYLAAAEAIINPEAFRLLKNAKRVLILFEISPDSEYQPSFDEVRHLRLFETLFKHLDDFTWDFIKNSDLGATVNVYIFIIA